MLKTATLTLLLALGAGTINAQEVERAESSDSARASATVKIERTADGEVKVETSGEGHVEVERTENGVRVRATSTRGEGQVKLPDIDEMLEKVERRTTEAFKRARMPWNEDWFKDFDERHREVMERVRRAMEEAVNNEGTVVEEYEHVSEDGKTRIHVRIVRSSSSSESKSESETAPVPVPERPQRQ